MPRRSRRRRSRAHRARECIRGDTTYHVQEHLIRVAIDPDRRPVQSNRSQLSTSTAWALPHAQQRTPQQFGKLRALVRREVGERIALHPLHPTKPLLQHGPAPRRRLEPVHPPMRWVRVTDDVALGFELGHRQTHVLWSHAAQSSQMRGRQRIVARQVSQRSELRERQVQLRERHRDLLLHRVRELPEEIADLVARIGNLGHNPF